LRTTHTILLRLSLPHAIQGWLRDFGPARLRLHQILDDDGFNVEALTTLGFIEVAALQASAARNAFVRAQGIDPGNREAQRGLATLAAAHRSSLKIAYEYRRGTEVTDMQLFAGYRATVATAMLFEIGRVAPTSVDQATQQTARATDRIAAGVSHRGDRLGAALLLEYVPKANIVGAVVSGETAIGPVHVGAMGRARKGSGYVAWLGNAWTQLDLPASFAITAALYASYQGGQQRVAVQARLAVPGIPRTSLRIVGERRGDHVVGAGATADIETLAGQQLRLSSMFWRNREQWFGVAYGVTF
jgi:hypothetical protein